MKTLFRAIYSRWTSKGKIGLTELYDTEAPAGAVFPYGVFSMPSDVADWTFSENFENCLIQFNIFSKTSDSAEIDNCFELLKSAFDFYDLTVSGYGTVSLGRGVTIRFKEEGVWQYNVLYKIILQKV